MTIAIDVHLDADAAAKMAGDVREGLCAYEGLAKLAGPVAMRDRRVGDFTDTSCSGWVYPKPGVAV